MNIRDIARLSGVGVSTVSRVLNNHEDVKESTREKVMQVIKESNYIPNNSARMLKQNSTNNIGLLVKGVFNPLFSEMTNIIANIIKASKYTMILEQNDYNYGDDFDTLQSFIKEKRLQGAICLGGNFETVEQERLEALPVPVILTSVNTIFGVESKGYSSVGIDNIASAYKATDYLIKLGHKNILVIIGDENDLGISWYRLKGYKRALEDNQMDFDPNNMLIGDYNSRTAYNVVYKALKERTEITAIFAISDVMAVGAAKAAADMGLEIGQEISIIGFDGMDISEFYNPDITTVKQPIKEMAETSASLLLALLNGTEENKHIILDTELVKRKSCSNIVKV